MNRVFIPIALLIVAIFAFVSGSAYRTVEVEIAAEEARLDMNRERTARAISAAVEAQFAAFLEEENQRPFYHYQFFYVPEDVTGQGQSLLRSPLADMKTYDGVKFIAQDSSWLMLRGSGTEPILRIYAEARSVPDVRKLLKLGVRLTRQV